MTAERRAGGPPRTAEPRNDFAARFGVWLRLAYQNAGRFGSVEELAKAASAGGTKVSAGAIRCYFNGTRVPSLEAADALAAALGLTLEDFGAKKKSRKNARA